MNDLPTLSEEEIREWTDSTSFSRGKSYYSNGAIVNPRVQGMNLLADCRGSAPAPYRVEMTLDEEGIVSGYCSCPVGGGGNCKHCVALLLIWLYAPQSFTTMSPGLALGIKYRLGTSFGVLARARVHYLLYNVDETRSLGYAEVGLLLDYEFRE